MKLTEIAFATPQYTTAREETNADLFAKRCWHYLMKMQEHDERMLKEIREKHKGETLEFCTSIGVAVKFIEEQFQNYKTKVSKSCGYSAEIALFHRRPAGMILPMPPIDHTDIWVYYSQKEELLRVWNEIQRTLEHFCESRKRYIKPVK